MKKILLILLVSVITFACKNETKPASETEEGQVFRGEFIYTDNAAVLKGKDFLYGVQLDAKAKELANKTKPLQREEYDMVPVVIKGILKDNPNEGWEKIVAITEIVGVSAPTAELVTKVKSSVTEEETTNTTSETKPAE
ncbi:hypothetical protein [Aquimarina rhabdastrellae]